MLKIIELEVGHNKRLRSGLIENILYKPESPFQVIVGPNGVGKSAMLDEITAYPSPSNAFEKDGISRTVFDTDEGIIETKTIVNGSTRHEFWKGGENLNSGGTANVQKDLVLKYLSMNELGFDIATNKISFTRLPAAKRQVILAQLANNDMGYAYDLFLKARKKLSHAVGARNALEESLTEKKVANISDEEMILLEQRLEDYNAQVMQLLTELREDIPDNSNLNPGQWAMLNQDVASLYRRAPRTPLDATERAEYIQKINVVENSILTIKTQHRVLQEQYDSLDDVIKRSADSSEENISNRRAEVAHWTQRITELQSIQLFSPNLYPAETDYRQMHREILSVWDRWREVVSDMEVDQDGEFTRENFNALKETRDKYQVHMNSLTLKRSRYLEQQEHLRTGEKVDCPSCGLHFVPGMGKNAEKRIQDALNELGESILKGEQAIATVCEKLERIERWIGLYREMISLEKVCPSAELFFGEISHRVSVKKQPTQAIVTGVTLLEDVKYLEEIAFAQNKLRESQEILAQLEANNVKGLGDVITEHHGMQRKIESFTIQLREEEKHLAELTSNLNTVDQYQEKVSEQTMRYRTLLVESHNALEAIFNETRRVLIKDLQAHIGTLNKTLNDTKTLRAQIADTEKQLVKQKELILGYQQLVDGLSPKTGVVAEQMVGFIETFIAQMNAVIAEVWTYEMEILPGRETDSEISYIFPLKLHNDKDRIIPDIKEASDGQLGFIDFAFKVTAMLYLNQVNVPLLLDEVDRPLEPTHKERLMRFISQGVENERFSQVFLISHHASSHGALPYPDMVDFDFRNPQPESNRVATFR